MSTESHSISINESKGLKILKNAEKFSPGINLKDKDTDTGSHIYSISRQSKETAEEGKKYKPDPTLYSIDDVEEPRRGPGSYELPPICGFKGNISNIPNTPAYSIGLSRRLISGESNESGLEKYKSSVTLSSPGVGYYNPKFVTHDSPGYAPSLAERFKRTEAISEKHLPIMYSNELGVKKHSPGGVIAKASRFILKKDFPVGPGAYEVYHQNTIQQKKKELSQLYASRIDNMSHNAHEEHSPGPGDYDTQKSSLRSNFPRCSQVKRFKEVEARKGPTDYDTLKMDVLSKRHNASKATFGNEKKILNYKKVTAINQWLSKFGPAQRSDNKYGQNLLFSLH